MSNKKGRSSLSQTPKSAKKDGSLAAPIGSKRPREEEEDDSSIDEELDTAVFSSKKVKKLKQMIAEDGDHSKDKDGNEEEESDEDEEGSDEDDDEEDNSEGNSEDDDDEDDEEYDSNTDEEISEKVVKTTKQTKNASKQPEKQIKTSPVKTFESSAPFKASPANVVLFNLPRLKEDELRGFLTKRGVQPESISCITAPAALIGLPNEAAAKKAISACSGSSYGLKTLAAVNVSGDVSKIQTHKNPNPSAPEAPLTCVLATFIPKSVTEQAILKMINIKPKNVHLITRGAKNKVSNACYIDCNNENDAKKVYEALQGKEIENSRLKVHLKPQQNFNPITDQSFIVTNVPFTAGAEEVKKEFPTASQIDVTHKGCFLVQFATTDARNKAAESAKGKTMGGRVLRIVTSERSGAEFSIFIGNLPFQVKTEEVRAVYPKSNRIHLQIGKNGKCNGTAIIFFPTQEDADAAKIETSAKQIQGRTLRIKADNDETAAVKAPKPAKKEAEKSLPKKAELPAQVGSESEEDDKDDAEEDSDDAENEDGSDDEIGDSDEDEEDVDSQDNNESDSNDEPPAKKSKSQQPAHIPGGDKPRGGFKPFNNGGDKFHRGGRGGGGFHPRGGRGGGGFMHRGGRGGGGFRGGNFRGGRGRGGGTPHRGGRGFKRD